nr:mrna decapping complex subunit 2 [Quercus suber]
MGGTTNMSLPDHLDDLTVRFLLNLPASELSSVPRLCFQVEEAQWFYEDFIRPAAAAAGNPLPSLTLRQFCLALFQHCPMLKGFSDEMHIAAYEEFLAYKVRVPVRGAILMSEDMERLVLVKGWKKGASWSFPRGKINKNEADLDCAIREVYEETGYDVRQAGLVPQNENEVKAIDITMREQHVKLFVFRGVHEDTYFEPKTRKEISKIQWYNVRDLPGFKRQKNGDAQHANKFYMVAPFLSHLKKWIKEQRQNDARLLKNGMAVPLGILTEDEDVTDTIADKAEELRKLLMISGPHQDVRHEIAPQFPPLPQPGSVHQSHTNDLLALLKGPGQVAAGPQTPIEQISIGVPPEPPAPQPQYPRHTPSQHLSSPPQAGYIPNLSHQTYIEQFSGRPSEYEGGPGGFLQHTQPSQWMQMQHNHKAPQHNILAQMNMAPHTTNQQGSMPDTTSLHRNISQENAQEQQQQPSDGRHQPASHQLQQSWIPGQPIPASVGPQGLHGPIATGPSAPNAENLPVPKMNAHAMKLLGAFKSPVQVDRSGPSTQAGPGVKQASAKQDALLGLLKQGKESSTIVKQDVEVHTENPRDSATLQRRQSALNEITRTLPAMKIKSPPPVSPRSPLTKVERPKPASNAATSQKTTINAHIPTSEPGRASLAKPQQVSKTILQRPGSSGLRQTAQIAPSSPPAIASSQERAQRMTNKSKKHATKSMGPMGTAPTKPFTILARPVSRPGSGSGSGFETDKVLSPGYAPRMGTEQLASRHVQQEAQTAPTLTSEIKTELRADGDIGISSGITNEDKKDQLLALFGRKDKLSQATTKSASKPAPSPSSTTVSRPSSTIQANNSRAGPQGGSRPIRSPNPPADGTTPAVTEDASAVIPPEVNKQNSLLDLLMKSTPSAASLRTTPFDSHASHETTFQAAVGSSPATPISPFILGTPARALAPGLIGAGAAQPHPRSSANSVNEASHQHTASRSASVVFARDVVSPVSSAAGRLTGASTPTATPLATPTETKGFLLSYLNGVVQKEGARGNALKRS